MAPIGDFLRSAVGSAGERSREVGAGIGSAAGGLRAPEEPASKGQKWASLIIVLAIFIFGTVAENPIIRWALFIFAIVIFAGEHYVFTKFAEKTGIDLSQIRLSTVVKVSICILFFFFFSDPYLLILLIVIWLVVSTVVPPIWAKIQEKRGGHKAAEGAEGMLFSALLKGKGILPKGASGIMLGIGFVISITFLLLGWYIYSSPISGLLTGIFFSLLISMIWNFATGGFSVGALFKILVVFVMLMIASAPVFLCAYFAGGDSPVGKVCTAGSKAMLYLEEVIAKAPSKIVAEAKKQQAIAVGDYYTGQVDANAQKTLGVYLEDIKQADVRFYEDLPVTMFTTLKAQTLDETINITVNCSSPYQKKAPKIFPDPPKFTVDVYEERDIDCAFDAGSLRNGVVPIEFSASFSFKTMAYLKTYFMDQATLRSLRRENIDPLAQYGITDTNPVTIYTAGPVGIGMKVEAPPIGIDRESDQRVVTLGLTIENNWEGEVRSIEDLALIIPSGFELVDMGGMQIERIACNDLKEKVSGCTDEIYNIYRITPPANERAIPVDGFKTFRGHLRLSQASYEKVLGAAPVATHYFKATLRYTYSLIKKKTVEITPSSVPGSIIGGSGVDLVPPELKSKSANATSSSITVKWETTEPSLDTLLYWLPSSPLNKWQAPQSEANYSINHATTIPGLSPNTTYAYWISSRDVAGNVKTTPAYSASTTVS